MYRTLRRTGVQVRVRGNRADVQRSCPSSSSPTSAEMDVLQLVVG